jgi:hypothetical protein
VELYLHFPNTPSWRGVQLKYLRDNLTIIIIIIIIITTTTTTLFYAASALHVNHPVATQPHTFRLINTLEKLPASNVS